LSSFKKRQSVLSAMILMRLMNAARYSALVGGTTAIAAVTLQAAQLRSIADLKLLNMAGKNLLGFLDIGSGEGFRMPAQL
jgi:hypothetical protein